MPDFPLREAIDQIADSLPFQAAQDFMDLMQHNGLYPCEHEDAWEILILQAENTLKYSCTECPAQWEQAIS